jgi:hypothetical protein
MNKPLHYSALLLIALSLATPLWGEIDATNRVTAESDPIVSIPNTASDPAVLEPVVEQTISSPPLGLFQMAQLSESQTQLLKARDQYKVALLEHPEDSVLREKYGWFLYSNGYHDKECLRLLEMSLKSGTTSNPVSLFNAIVEVRDELGLPETPLKKPEGYVGKSKDKKGTAAYAARSAKPSKGKNTVEPELTAEDPYKHWLVIPSYSYSFFNEGRQGWQEEDVQLFYRVNRKFTIGGEVDILQRPPSGTNIYYSAIASYYLWKYLEVHGKISICPAPTFAATQIYSGGFIYQAAPRLGVLFDYQHYNFIQGPIDQVNPGLVYNFNDENSIAVRYVRGWAFYNLDYNYYSAALNLGLPGKRRLSLAFAYGTDPDAEVGANGNNVTSLSPAYTYSVFFTQPVTRDLNLFAGVQYCYRLTQDYSPLYQQLTPSVGLALKF